MRIKLILIALSFLWINIPSYGQYDPDFYDNYTVIPGQSAMPAIGAFKDSRGFIWIETLSGLYRYDGIGMKHYFKIPGDSTTLSANLIRTILFEDSLNRLWISNISNCFDILDLHTGKVRQLIPETIGIERNKVGGLISGCQDEKGNIIGRAIGGFLLRYDLERNILESVLIDPEHPDSSINYVRNIFKDRDANIWIGTRFGLFLYHAGDRSFSRPELPSEGSELLNESMITDMLQDSHGTYWIASSNGLFKYDSEESAIKHFYHLDNDLSSLSHNWIRCMHLYPPDSGNTLLLHTYNGYNFFNMSDGKTKSYLIDVEDPAYTHMKVFYNEIVDETGRVWITTDNLKLIVLTPEEDVFRNVQITDESQHHYMGASFCKDDHGNLWVGTAYGGLFQYDTNMNIIGHYQYGPEDSWIKNYFLYSLLADGDDIWLGFAGYGLGKFNIRTKEFERILRWEDFTESPLFRIHDIHKDRFGVIWFCSSNGIYFIDTNIPGAMVRKIKILKEEDAYALSMYEDMSGNLWFAVPGKGLSCLPLQNREDTSFIWFSHDDDRPGSLISNEVACICQDKDGNYWIGSDIELMRFFPEDSSFQLFEHKYSRDYITISNIKRDRTGTLWFICNKGIVRFSPEADEENTFRTMTKRDGMPFTEFYSWKFHIDRDGILYFGGVRGSGNGFFYFNPKDIPVNRHIPPVVLTSFRVRNEELDMDSSITMLKRIDLNYYQNYFSFEFAALDYVNPEKNNYAYMLKGFDEDWIYSGTRHFASYTGVPPGTYTFMVKGSNNDGYWNEDGTSVRLVIAPPPWRTWWAYSFYGVVFILLVVAWRRYDLKRQRLKKDLEIEQVEAQKLKEVDKLKSKFFANISHEFRTPLTLILGPLEKLRIKISDAEAEQDFNIIQRNARRLQQLINQLLSLSRIESGNMKLQAREEDIVSLTRGYVHSFESLAQQKNIVLKFETNTEYQLVYLDRDKIEKILYNLLSNALKFTRNGGNVSVILKDHDDHISICINDTGPGMDKDQLDHVFDRFYRGDETHHVEGSGIGLALSRELVELHHGTIRAESEKGKGSTFEVIIKKGRDHLAENEIITSPEEEMEFAHIPIVEDVDQADARQEPMLSEKDLLSGSSKPLLLIVEDNRDLRQYIRGYFIDEYEVLEAEDGSQGQEKALEFLPDIIISDVMMPNMDGYELGEKLKTDQRTSHIPLILLTARASTESKMEGLETGADDFITKPFDPQELQVRVKNLVEQRKRLSEYYRENIGKPDARSLIDFPLSAYSKMDRKFIEKAIEVIGKHMGNSEFSVEDYSSSMAMSRVQLHRKLKGLLNLSPSDLIRMIRLKKAAELLKKGSGTVTEIAYEVGFNNLSYFARCFQETYGYLPSEYPTSK